VSPKLVYKIKNKEKIQLWNVVLFIGYKQVFASIEIGDLFNNKYAYSFYNTRLWYWLVSNNSILNVEYWIRHTSQQNSEVPASQLNEFNIQLFSTFNPNQFTIVCDQTSCSQVLFIILKWNIHIVKLYN
jgi:hypothetical protein